MVVFAVVVGLEGAEVLDEEPSSSPSLSNSTLLELTRLKQGLKINLCINKQELHRRKLKVFDISYFQ